ncbi:hypothetical protein ACHAW6_001082 [Cyclotella cf. meneghiniana]
MGKRYLSGIAVLDLGNFWDSPISICLWLPMSKTCPPVLCLLSIMWYLMTCSKQCSALGITTLLRMRSATIFLSTIRMSMQRMNLILMEIVFITLHLWMKSGWMSQKGEIVEIVFVVSRRLWKRGSVPIVFVFLLLHLLMATPASMMMMMVWDQCHH